MRKLLLKVILLSTIFPLLSFAESVDGYTIERNNFTLFLNPDYTFEVTQEIKISILTESGAKHVSQMTFDFWPQSETFEVIESYIQKKTGEKLFVPKEQIFIRTSSSSKETPGFLESKTATIVFPQVKKGSSIYIKYKKVKNKKSPMGFSVLMANSFLKTKELTGTIIAPKNLYLNYGFLGDVKVLNSIIKNQRILKISIPSTLSSVDREPNMLDDRDIFPLFALSSLKTWEEMGAIIYKKYKKKLIVTENVQKLSNKIVAGKQGIEAAKAIYYWVNKNIRYLAVYLHPDRSIIANSPEEILQRGYGDCKDQSVVMQALLKAQGINSYPALIYLGKSFITSPAPIPKQFNHMILYIPEFNVFLDSTDQYQKFGEINPILSNKITVIATKEGKVIYTPKIESKTVVYKSFDTFKLENENILSNTEIIAKSSVAASIRKICSIDDLEFLANQILANNSLGGIGDYKPNNLDDLENPLLIKAFWEREKFYKKTKSIYFHIPTGLSFIGLKDLQEIILLPKRRYPLYFPISNSVFEYKIPIPEGYKVRKLPEDREVKNGKGSFVSKYIIEEGNIRVKRRIIIPDLIHYPDNYSKLLDVIYEALMDERSVIEFYFEK